MLWYVPCATVCLVNYSKLFNCECWRFPNVMQFITIIISHYNNDLKKACKRSLNILVQVDDHIIIILKIGGAV